MNRFDAVLFDLDGTLLNTQDFILQAFNHTLTTHKYPVVTWEMLRPTIGMPLEAMYQAISSIEEANHLEGLIETHRAFQEANLHLSGIFANVPETLERLSTAGIKMAIVTSRGSRTAGSTLEIAQIMQHFQVMITADDTQELKPHPGPILKALERLNVSPKRAMMVGDTEFDIIAGKRAGTATFGVTYGFSGPQIAVHKPDALVGDITDILPLILGE